ncbi:MAG: hypothetical protein LQ342_006852 [Letrouitia transgressa]|nr:MAG: hypothetical protein LQ342_006852 [Letrouitia transgressa]
MRSTTIALALSFLPFLPNLISACQLTTGIKLTNYGFPDASGTPKYKCVNGRPQNTVAGDRTELGDGSIRDPYAAAASANSIFQRCEVFYVPILKKYFRVQDDCSGCVARQADLYLIQSNANIGQTNCELAFGTLNYGRPLHSVLRQPGAGFQTAKRPLFENGKCFNNPADGRVFPDRDRTAKCPTSQAADAPEELSSVDLGKDTDFVDDTGSTNDVSDGLEAESCGYADIFISQDDPAARHRGMKDAGSPPQVSARAFEA